MPTNVCSMKLSFYLIIIACSIFGTCLADDSSQSVSFDPKIPHGFGSGILREQSSCLSVEWPIGSRKNADKAMPAEPSLQIWLLKADGSTLSQNAKPSRISIGSIGDSSTDYLIFNFQKVPIKEVVGVVVSLDGQLYSAKLGAKLSQFLTTPQQTYLTEQVSEILSEVNSIQPGCKRGDLAKYFDPSGGLFPENNDNYVSRMCPYIKINIDFKKTEPKTPCNTNDVIEKISRPFVETPIYD